MPVLLLLLPGCGVVDLNAVPEAKALCDSSSAELRAPGARMLPGRRCLLCHVEGGQAGRYPWTVAGTVFDSLSPPSCNTNGVEGATVEILDPQFKTVLTMTTNRAGNFFSAEPLGTAMFAFRARISKPGKTTRQMSFLGTTTDCAFCHYGDPMSLPGGRIFLD